MSIGGVGSASAMRSYQPPSFSTLDADSSGGITLEELKAATAEGTDSTKSSELAEKLFTAMDADGNGSVSSGEKDAFDASMAEQRQAMQFMVQQFASAMSPPSNDDVFAATDADGSGSVSLEEFSASNDAGLSTEELSELFNMIDTDGDGAITETESSDFLDALKSAAETGPMGPPPGGPPPSESASTETETDTDTEEDDDVAVDLLTAARAAYSSQSASSDLLETLSRILDEAA